MTLTTKPIIRRIDRRGGRHYVVEGDPQVEGVELPSVTTVLQIINKPALVPWARNISLEKVRVTMMEGLRPSDNAEAGLIMPGGWAEYVDKVIEEARRRPDQVRDQAADFGTRAHIIIADLLEGQEPEYGDEFKPVVNAFLEWQRTSGLQMTASERMVYSVEDRYGGALDIKAAGTDGRRAIVDIKTSNGIYPEFALQVAAYAKADKEMESAERGETYDPGMLRYDVEGWIVRLSKTPPKEGENGFEARRIADLTAAYEAFRAARELWGAMREEMWG